MPEDINIEKIPNTILDMVNSEKTSVRVSEICLKNKVEDEKKIEDIAYQIGLVLLGKLPPEELAEALEKNVKVSADVAKKIALEVDQLIFPQVKNELDELYNIKKKPVPPPQEEKPKRPPRKDVYRESAE